MNVDIVIPIYNAYEFTKKCIETVIKYTDLKKNTLVLVNDKSPDEKILPMLKQFEKEYSELNIVVIDSKVNGGFVKSVNIGMSRSKNDVILLNSDTEVTKDWLDKMQKVAYIRKNVATVTPLSNNASLASIPNFCEENDLPNFMTLEDYAQSIEDCSFNEFPEIPTAHGFCVYIKREAIDVVGLFDDVTFEKGYGEENDFSYRCIKAGFVHLLCDNTFIYHKGTQSFSVAKQEFILSHLKLLQKMYPQNFYMTDKFCIDNPISYIQDNIKYYINNKNRKNILLVAHEFIRNEKLLGGTVFHILDVISELRKYFNFHVLYADGNDIRLTSYFEDSQSTVSLGYVNSYEAINLYNNEYKKIVEKLFQLVNIDFVHIHHMKNHYLDIFDVINSKKIPYMVSVHDYYFLCPLTVVGDNAKNSCIYGEKCDAKNCFGLLENSKAIDFWREKVYEILKDAKSIITPSNTTKDILLKTYKNLNVTVIEHGSKKLESDAKPNKFLDKKNIAFIGGVNNVKGFEYVKEFVSQIEKKDIGFNVHLFGGTSENMLNESNKGYYYHGKYDRDDIVKLLKENNIDLVCLFSVWPETFAYTLTEAVMAKVPVLVLENGGALPERTAKDNLGWIIGKDATIEEIIEKINQIFENTEEYEEKVKSVEKYVENLKSVEEMSNEYKEIYDKNCIKINEDFKGINKEELKFIFRTKMLLSKLNEKDRMNDENQKRLTEYHNLVMSERANYNEMVQNYDHRISEYHNSVMEYRVIADKYNHLTSSKRLKLLKKFRFIKY